MSVFTMPVSAAYHLVAALTAVLHPALGPLATAAAIVLFTAGVRLLLLPLALRQARAQRVREQLLPQIQKLQHRHRKDPARAQGEITKLYENEGASPLAGCLPTLAQWPFFMVTYRVFTSASVAGQRNVLLAHTLLGHSLVGVLSTYGILGAPTLLYLALLALIAAVAWWSSRKAQGWLKLLPFGTVAFAAYVPMAAAIYLLTTTTWTAVERTRLMPAS